MHGGGHCAAGDAGPPARRGPGAAFGEGETLRDEAGVQVAAGGQRSSAGRSRRLEDMASVLPRRVAANGGRWEDRECHPSTISGAFDVFLQDPAPSRDILPAVDLFLRGRRPVRKDHRPGSGRPVRAARAPPRHGLQDGFPEHHALAQRTARPQLRAGLRSILPTSATSTSSAAQPRRATRTS